MTFNDFRSLAENSPDVIVRYDRDCRRVYVNPAYERVNGIVAAEVLGKTPAEFSSGKTVAGGTAVAIEDLLRRTLATGRPAAMDLTWADGTGGTTCFELRAIPELDSEGEVATVLTVARDVSELRESMKRYSMLVYALDQIPSSLYLVGDNARICHVNSEACRELGYTRIELLGKDILSIFPNLPQGEWTRFRHDLQSRNPATDRSTHRRRDGSVFPVETRSIPFAFDGEDYVLFVAQNLTDRLNLEQEQSRLVQELRTLVENSPDGIGRYDRDCRRVYANSTFVRLTGLPLEEILGKRPTDLQDTDSARKYEAAVHAAFATRASQEFEYSWPVVGNRTITSHVRLVPELDGYGEVVSVLAVGRDITALKEVQARLQEAEAMAGVGHWQWDFAQGAAIVSSELCRIFGQPQEWNPSLDDLLTQVIDDEDPSAYGILREALNHRQSDVVLSYRIKVDGRLVHLHTIARIIYGADGLPCRLTAATQDITELKNTELRLQELTRHDLLTGLPNRNLLMERLHRAISRSARLNESLGLLVINLDRFKDVNDIHGHNTGDRLLFAFAERLRNLVRDNDIVAHLGGDRFSLVLRRVRCVADLGTISRQIIDDLAFPFQIDDLEIFASASIGIAVFPNDGTNALELLQHADSALNEAKRRGRSSFHYYSEELSVKSKERVFLEAALRHAKQEEQFELYFQPKVDLRSNRLTGAEALLRWKQPDRGLLTPDKFIGVAEETGLIVGIGVWVLTTACHAVQRWNSSARRKLRLAINLSARQFRGNDLAATILGILAATGCDPDWLELEITESLLLEHNTSVRSTLEALRNAGVTIAIDDFGTGYSALGYLKQFPIDVLKIDRSFVRGIGDDDFSSELVKVILSMGKCLGMDVVAEGVETETQERFLRDHGCPLVQGYRYGRPIPASAFEALESFREVQARPMSCGQGKE